MEAGFLPNSQGTVVLAGGANRLSSFLLLGNRGTGTVWLTVGWTR